MFLSTKIFMHDCISFYVKVILLSTACRDCLLTCVGKTVHSTTRVCKVLEYSRVTHECQDKSMELLDQTTAVEKKKSNK